MFASMNVLTAAHALLEFLEREREDLYIETLSTLYSLTWTQQCKPWRILSPIATICFSNNTVNRRFVLATYATNARHHIHDRGCGSSDHDRPPNFDQFSAYSVPSSVPTSKQHLHTQRVSSDHTQLSQRSIQYHIASIRYHISGICPSTIMAA